MSQYDVVIVGAGIIGCACAMECARAGMCVAIVESGEPGAGATGAAMGHVVAMADSPAQLALSRYSQRLWLAMSPELPSGVEFEQRGTIWVAADDTEMAEVYARQTTYVAAGVSTEVLDGAALARAEPNLRRGLAGGLLVHEDAVVDPSAALAYFLEQALRNGARLLRGKRAVKVGGGGVSLADGDRLSAGKIVVATGTGRHLLGELPIQWRKGHLAITEPSPGFVNHQLVELAYTKSANTVGEDSVAFNVQPRRNGQVVVGSSRQYRSEDAAVEEEVMRRMLDQARLYLPELDSLPRVRIWTGFRAATPDKLPYLGPGDDPTVGYAVGFEGLGITSAPGAARIVLDELLGREAEIDTTPYLPSRMQAIHA